MHTTIEYLQYLKNIATVKGSKEERILKKLVDALEVLQEPGADVDLALQELE